VTTWPYLLFALLAGAMLPFQFGINAVLAGHLDSPVRASLVSFVVGAAALQAATVLFARGWPGGERLAGAPWWSGSAGCSGPSTSSARW
jgi:transporter family-2 protein